MNFVFAKRWIPPGRLFIFARPAAVMNSAGKEMTSSRIWIVWIAAALLATAPALLGNTELRRDETVRAVEKAMPSVVNISSKTVQRQRGYCCEWSHDNWSP